MKNRVQLITYVDRLSGGGFPELRALLDGKLQGLFGGVHALPFFDPTDGADAGFDPTDHTIVDPRLGNWDDVRGLAGSVEIMADLIVNHVSAQSSWFQDFIAKGPESEFADMFTTFGKVFPRGASEQDLLNIYRPRPGLPFSKVTLADGSQRMLWTTFTPQQIDIDVHSAHGALYLETILDRFAEANVTAIRLDAAGYAIKKAGTSCFMIDETYAFLAKLAEMARDRGMEVLVEIHSYYRDQIEIARKVDRVYDFALPPLILHSLFTGDATALARWLEISPRNAITVLDTHDGIGVIDVGAHSDGRPGLLEPQAIDHLVEEIHRRSEGQSRLATGAAASNLDLYQVNCTYYDALGRNDNDYLIARAIQFFAPGIPQVYYVGLLGGINDMRLLGETGVGRDINRHFYQDREINLALETPLVKRLSDLIRFRNTHPAFNGSFKASIDGAGSLVLIWNLDAALAELRIDFIKRKARITASGECEIQVSG
ncbi:sucrose phosphorylase [Agrobacterium tumefaciens]|uniref:Sucrose phosphorylase n=1 Tax=Agrobacterium tumefaciens TaxID=358 RepID=A0A2Z2Q2Z2_AGRTU|nr:MULTISPECIES: sucrose phosphorylase [Agrobacterium]ASK48871.1 sucrose phosphorylase [Agrobacterium radiobacter]MBO0127937.1 sucrose phosphorylase [Agrobacterium sp. OT33]MCF1480187.1 sucrose phosphorylase [Agrobacterium vitis]NTA44628.1 sucrose phosphorylase [Agrobacterium tumefaciens]NTA48920.1 sucrose phosphorylase [Agrobacterium tumefaciens]